MDEIRWSEVKTCRVSCEPRQFLKAIQIWVEKPHVVNRRLAASVPLGSAVETECNAVNAFLKQDFTTHDCEALIIDFLRAQQTTELRNTDTDHARTQLNLDRTTPTALPIPCPNSVRVCARKLIPKAKKVSAQTAKTDDSAGVDKEDVLFEFIMLDLETHEATFIPLIGITVAKCAYKFSLNTESSTSIALSLPDNYLEPSSTASAITRPTSGWLINTLLPKLARWSAAVDPDTPISSSHALISVERYSQLYAELKPKYGPKFVEMWPETTDPQKYVYEDVAIATYILLLWEQEREEEQLQSKQSFVDLGCGNGLLVHILNGEGHPGKGIDLRSRGIWSLYGEDTHLEECSIIPSDKHLFPDTDWLIGNHSDELTPWIPVMATRSSPNTRYFVLPCCFHDFAAKFIRRNPNQSQYRAYLDFVREVGEVCEFEVQEDSMRIPSTKRICQVGTRNSKLGVQEQELLDQKIQEYISKRCPSGLMRNPITNLSHGSRLASSVSNHGEFDSSLNGKSTTSVSGEDVDLNPVHTTATDASKLPGGQWAESFQPRDKVEAVRNCSKLSRDLKERMVSEIANALLKADNVMRGEAKEMEGNEDVDKMVKTRKLWRRGGKMTFGEAAALFDSDVMKQLKSEHGGLKTLLKNANQVFEVQANSIQLRDWTTASSSVGAKQTGNTTNNKKHKGHNKDTIKYIKSRQCWFQANHPDGCPLLTTECTFAHGPDDLQRTMMK